MNFSFVTCNILKIACVANVNNFSVIIRYFILIATYVTLSFKNKTFLHVTKKYLSKNRVKV